MMQRDGGLQYTSKMDDFDTFVSHAKLSTLSLQPSSASSDAAASQAASQQAQSQVTSTEVGCRNQCKLNPSST